MPKEKTLKIDKQTVIIICVSVLLVVGFLVWDNNNKREVELQREKMEQEKSLEEQKLEQEKSIIEQERTSEWIKEEREKYEEEYAKQQWLECMQDGVGTVNTKEAFDLVNSICRDKSGFTGVTPISP